MLSIQALVVIDWHEKYLDEFYHVAPKKIVSGELKCHESVSHGLETAGSAFVDMLTGMTTGKAVIVLSDE